MSTARKFSSWRASSAASADTTWLTMPDSPINGLNLQENILPTRGRASLILEKGPDHAVRAVHLRKL